MKRTNYRGNGAFHAPYEDGRNDEVSLRPWDRALVCRSRGRAAAAVGAWIPVGPHDVGGTDRRSGRRNQRVPGGRGILGRPGTNKSIRPVLSRDRARSPRLRPQPRRRKGVGNLFCEAPSGPFREKVPDTFSPPDTVTMDRFADDLAGLLDGLAIREPVVLWDCRWADISRCSFGGDTPARLRGLILCDTRASADTPEAAAARHGMAERVLREGPAPLVESMLPRLFAETTRRQQPQLVERLRSVMMSGDPRGMAAAARGMAERPDMTAMLGRFAAPRWSSSARATLSRRRPRCGALPRRFRGRSSSKSRPPVIWRRWKTRRR